VLALGAPVAALGCSPAQGYVRPSNYELVQIADVIVVATPIGVRDTEKEAYFDHKVVFRVVQTLKGEVEGEIEVVGLTLGRTRPSDAHEILSAHPEAYMGACNRRTMAKGAAYVLFLSKTAAGYTPLGYPFSRVNEDYAGEDSPWVRTVRTYLRLQNSEAPMAQLSTLEGLRAEIQAKTSPSRDEQALATDIEMHLGSPSPWKPTEFLLSVYEDLKAGRAPRYKPRSPAFDTEQSEVAAFTDLIMKGSGLDSAKPPPPPRRDPRQTALLEMLIEGDHPKAMPIFEAFTASGAPADDLAMAVRFYARNGRYREAYRLIEERAVPMIAIAPETEARLLLGAISDVQQDPFYGEGQPRWRDEPDIAERWPKLALKLTLASEERFDDDPGYTETLKGVLGSDYRANPDLTLMLSGHVNEIGDWAKRELTREDNLAASTGGPDDPLRLPMRIVIRWMGLSDGDKDIAVLTPAFCLGSAQRRMLFQDIGSLGSTFGGQQILQFAAANVVDGADRRVLTTAVPAWDRRYSVGKDESWLKADPSMLKLARGEVITAKDIKPLKPVTCPTR
jgi:hypothetical protein